MISQRLTHALDAVRNSAESKNGNMILPLDAYQLLYYTALNARNKLQEYEQKETEV